LHRMNRHLIVLVGVGLIALLMLGCSRFKGSDSPLEVQVSGRVLAYICGPLGEPEVGHYPDTLPYSVQTGLPAEIEFTSESGVTTSLETNKLSTFELTLPLGLYSIRIETDHTRPDVFDKVALTADTAMNLVIRYDYAVTNLIYLAFCYESSGSMPLTPEAERAILDELNDDVGGLLLLDDATRFPSSCVLYRIPTVPDHRLWEVAQAVGFRVRTTNVHEALRMSVPNYGICPEDFVVIGDTIFVIPFDSMIVMDPPDSIVVY